MVKVVRAKLTGTWEGGGCGGEKRSFFFFFFLGNILTQVLMQSTLFWVFLGTKMEETLKLKLFVNIVAQSILAI